MDYLAKQQARPFQSHLNIAGLCTHEMGIKAQSFVGDATNVHPENAAIWFYMQNHTQAALSRKWDKYEPLSTDAIKLTNAYYENMNYESLRMFFYLLLICVRESRHIKNLSTVGPDLAKIYGGGCKTFTNKIKGSGSSTAVSRFYEHAPKVPLGNYCSWMFDLFKKGSWGGGYGGEAWADVAQVLRDFVLGTITAEMMMDTAFTLAHNNGPIFNKGLVFYTQDNYQLIRILDVQRSGQIPQMVAAGDSDYVKAHHKEYQKMAEQTIGPEMGGYVDWYAVEKLGAAQSYPGDKKAQDQKYGKLKGSSIATQAMQAKNAAVKAKMAESAFSVMPSISLKKLTRKEVAA